MNTRSALLNALVGRVMLGVNRLTQMREGIRSFTLRQRSKIRDAAAYAKQNKIRWAGHVMRFDDNRWTRAVTDWTPLDVKRERGRPPARWSDMFTKSFNEVLQSVPRVPGGITCHLYTKTLVNNRQRQGRMEASLVPARATR